MEQETLPVDPETNSAPEVFRMEAEEAHSAREQDVGESDGARDSEPVNTPRAPEAERSVRREAISRPREDDRDYDHEDEDSRDDENENDYLDARSERPRSGQEPSRRPQATSAPRGEDRAPSAVAQAPRAEEQFTEVAYYDRNARQYVAMALEFPEMKASGASRSAALSQLENRLQQHVQNMKRKGEQVPEGIFSRHYPEKLEFRLSQGLYRRLDLLSRQEKIALEPLLVELLTSALDRRNEAQRPKDRRPAQAQPGNSNHQHQHQRHHGGNHAGGNSHNRQQGGGRRNANYRETMDNRENFMEYVRNLEKGNWRKK